MIPRHYERENPALPKLPQIREKKLMVLPLSVLGKVPGNEQELRVEVLHPLDGGLEDFLAFHEQLAI